MVPCMLGTDLPHALEAFEEIVPPASELALFLDYDGTLTPIVDRPEDAQLSEAMRATLVRLGAQTPIILVSGRERSEVADLIGFDGPGFVGSHGFDIRGPQGSAVRHEVGTDALPALDRAERLLREELADVDGALVERKRFGLAAHYRLASEAGRTQIEAAVHRAQAETEGLRLAGGKMVLELRPDLDWDKGRAVLWLLETLHWERRLPIHIGDDLTDETVFAALHERGTGILVADSADAERETAARYRLENPEEVRLFLGRIAEHGDASR